jgi:hypothetical protein
MTSARRLPWVWDYDLDAAEFQALVDGTRTIGSLDRTWAVMRLLEYAPWPDIVRILGYRALVTGWPEWRHRLRSESRRRGLGFVAEWLPSHHPHLLA